MGKPGNERWQTDNEFGDYLEGLIDRAESDTGDTSVLAEAFPAELDESLQAKDKLDVHNFLQKTRTGQMRLWPVRCHIQSNDMLRSALFSCSRTRTTLKNQPVMSHRNIEFVMTGETLNQWDELLWMELIQRSRENQSLSVPGTFYSLAKHLGHKMGGGSRKRLQDSLDRMQNMQLVIRRIGEDRVKQGRSISLITGYDFLEVPGKARQFVVHLHPTALKLVLLEGYTIVDWETHLKLPVGITTWLHRYVRRQLTHPKAHEVRLSNLHPLTGSTLPSHEFKRQLKGAMDALQGHGVVTEWSISPDNKLFFKRPLSKKQILQMTGQDKDSSP